jgi:hypothetical protein
MPAMVDPMSDLWRSSFYFTKFKAITTRYTRKKALLGPGSQRKRGWGAAEGERSKADHVP